MASEDLHVELFLTLSLTFYMFRSKHFGTVVVRPIQMFLQPTRNKLEFDKAWRSFQLLLV